MPELSPAARGAAHGAKPRRVGWWRCLLCSERRTYSPEPAQAFRYHYLRTHVGAGV